MRGPMEIALDDVVRRALGRDEPLAGDGRVEWVRQHGLGEFRFDLRPLLGTDWPDKADAEKVTGALAELPEITKAVFVPPRVYVKVSQEFLRDVVLRAATSTGAAYGALGAGRGRTAAVTFSDPNVNKPLHVGHLRNNLLGIAVARLLENEGWAVRRSELFSDWGLHICRALLGYLKWGDGATPETAGVPGDVFVGDYYVRFHRESMKQIRGARSALPGPLLEDQAAELLRALEHGDEPDLVALKTRMTGWAEQGIGETYARIGCRFEGRFRERANLAVGRELVERGLASGVCHRRPDGSVYVDLARSGFTEYGELTLLRPDGTQLVYTRAFGALVERHRTHPADRTIDVLGSDWEIAYAAFLEALAVLGEEWARSVELVFHGMVRMPDGKMKSREGLVVSARELLDRAARGVAERWALPAPPPAGEVDAVADALGVGLVKYHLLATLRGRDSVFDEGHLWDVRYPRYATLLRTVAAAADAVERAGAAPLPPPEAAEQGKAAAAWRKLLHVIEAFPRTVGYATRDLEPSNVVRYLDDLCEAVRQARKVGDLGSAWHAVDAVLARALWLLGIELPPAELWSRPGSRARERAAEPAGERELVVGGTTRGVLR